MGLFDRKSKQPSPIPQRLPPREEFGPQHPDDQPYRIVGVWNIEEVDGKRQHTTPNYEVERITVTPAGHGKTYEKGDVVWLTAGLARVVQKHVILEPQHPDRV